METREIKNSKGSIIYRPKWYKIPYPEDLPDFFFCFLDIDSNIETVWNEFAESKRLPHMKFDVKLGGPNHENIVYVSAESGAFIPDDILPDVGDKKFILKTDGQLDGTWPDVNKRILPYIQFTMKLIPENPDDNSFEYKLGNFYYDIFNRKFFTEMQYVSAYPNYFRKYVKA